jgi:hypothetical protein
MRRSMRQPSIGNPASATAEWTRLEPAVLTEKFYVKGTGEVREVDVAGGDEHQELASVVHG